MGVQLPDHATFTQIELVSPQFPDVFGVRPISGALFRSGDASHQALVSEAFADAELGGAGVAVGKLVGWESQFYQVVGVLPRGFDFPQKTSIWIGSPAAPDNAIAIPITTVRWPAYGRDWTFPRRSCVWTSYPSNLRRAFQ